MNASGEEGHWLNEQRLRAYPRVLLCIFAATYAYLLLTTRHLVDARGLPFGNDFIEFWSASLAALRGHALAAYDTASLFPYQQVAVPALQVKFTWIYPPSFYLAVLPLAYLPYVAAYCVWMALTLGAYIVVLRRVVRGNVAMWCLAAFSGVWINFMDGQNGFLTAALAGAAIVCLGQRPYLAGVLVGLLVIKPQLAILFPVALLAIGAWRTIAVAAATAAGMMAAGVAVLGKATMPAWLASVHTMTASEGIPYEKMPTLIAMLRMWGAAGWVGYLVQGSVAMAAVAMVWWVWRRSGDWRLRGAALMVGTFLVTPYALDYDLAWLAFPIAWLALVGMETGWLAGEREVLTAAWILPLVSTPIASHTMVQVGPFVLAWLMWVAVRRAKAEHRGHREKGESTEGVGVLPCVAGGV